MKYISNARSKERWKFEDDSDYFQSKKRKVKGC